MPVIFLLIVKIKLVCSKPSNDDGMGIEAESEHSIILFVAFGIGLTDFMVPKNAK